jgi:hypothetical protein
MISCGCRSMNMMKRRWDFFRGGVREVTWIYGSQKEKHEEEENTIAVRSIEPRRLVGGNTNNRVVSGLPLAFLIDVRWMKWGICLLKNKANPLFVLLVYLRGKELSVARRTISLDTFYLDFRVTRS